MSNFVNLLDIVYPVGSIYISVNNVSPANSVGGTWEKIEDKFLKGASSNESSSSVGGNDSHYHKVMMAFPEYYGWSNITGTQDKGYAPTSGIVDVAKKLQGYTFTGSSGSTLFLNTCNHGIVVIAVLQIIHRLSWRKTMHLKYKILM